MFPLGTISVDTKQSLLELSGDLYADKRASHKKYSKCYKDGIKLVVLTEQRVESREKLKQWRNPHTRISGGYLLKMMDELTISYGVSFVFCDKRETPSVLLSILSGQKQTELQ